jgi:predicted metal-dependent enzyme (double-stranded beta helix superfamily)
MTLNRALYKPFGLAFSVAGGVLAGALFKKVWQVATGEKDAPNATDADRRWGEVLAAAALQGAIFALVKAAVDRGGAQGVAKVTGRWPG